MADFLIVGQGLAGTVLGWEFERAGFSFEIVDSVSSRAASRAGAGMINPVSGQRFTKSWRVDAWLPVALAAYAEVGRKLGIRIWEEKRLCIRNLDTAAIARLRAREKSGELSPYLKGITDSEAWIGGAARVDLTKLIEASAAHWRAAGNWREGSVSPVAVANNYQLVLDCRGHASARDELSDPLPWKFSKGETITIAAAGLEPDLILHAGAHWLLPTTGDEAVVGATHEPGVDDWCVTPSGRAALENSAERMLGGPVTTLSSAAGVRVHLPDKHPVVGRSWGNPRVGIFNGLGGKGTLWAPALARQWVHHLAEGVEFDPEVAISRFRQSGAA